MTTRNRDHAPPRGGPALRAARATRVEETTRLVARAIRAAVDRGTFSIEQAVEIAHVQLLRPGGPGRSISAEARAKLRDGITALARGLDVTQPRSILSFARGSAEAAWSMVKDLRHPGAGIADASHGSARELALAAVWAEATRARDSDDHVRRAVTRALRERKKSRGLVRVSLDDDDPLRTVLDVPARGKVLLPKADVRARIAEAAEGTSLGEVLRQVARFSDEFLRPALGEEIWALCRPVGFSDKAQRRVLLEVRSSMAAHEVQLRSREIVVRIRKVPGFEKIEGTKIVVVERSAFRVLS